MASVMTNLWVTFLGKAGVKVNIRVTFGEWLGLGDCQVDFLEMASIIVNVWMTFKEWRCWWTKV